MFQMPENKKRTKFKAFILKEHMNKYFFPIRKSLFWISAFGDRARAIVPYKQHIVVNVNIIISNNKIKEFCAPKNVYNCPVWILIPEKTCLLFTLVMKLWNKFCLLCIIDTSNQFLLSPAVVWSMRSDSKKYKWFFVFKRLDWISKDITYHDHF